ncbi:MAG: PDGLE domain-containing protein [Phormidesmis sp.]
MSDRPSQMQYGTFFLISLGIALAISAVLSPFASPNPDGLDRVSEDLGFNERAHPEPIATKLPFAGVFDGYAVRGVPGAIATPVAGIVGTLAAFGIAWGAGKLLVRNPASSSTADPDVRDYRD